MIKISKGKSVHLKPQTWKQFRGQLATVKNQYKQDVIFNNSEIKYAVSMLGIGVWGEKKLRGERCGLLAITVDTRASRDDCHLLSARLCVLDLLQHPACLPQSMCRTSASELIENPVFPGFPYMPSVQTGEFLLPSSFPQGLGP